MLLERRQARWLIAWRPLAAAAGPSCHEFWGALPPHPHPQLPEIVMFGCVNNPPSHNVHVLHVPHGQATPLQVPNLPITHSSRSPLPLHFALP